MLIRFAARNVFRHRLRSAITLTAIAFGVAALIVIGGFVSDLYRQLGEAIIHSQTGHLQIARPALFAEGSRTPEKYRIADFKSVASELAGLPGVKEVAGRLSFAGLISNHRTELPTFGEGVEPDKESALMSSVTLLAGRAFAPRETDGVLVGEGLAKKLGIKPGDLVTILAPTIDGAMNSADLQVVGVFRSFSKDYDARAVKMPLQGAQELLGTGDVNTVVLTLEDTSKTDTVLALAVPLMQRHGLAVKSWKQLNEFYKNTVKLFDREFGVLNLIILFMVVLGVGNTVSMAAFERLGEFGTMRALGNRRGKVAWLVMAECVLLGVIGATAGLVLGTAIATLVSAVGIPMPPPPNSNIGYTAVVPLVPGVVMRALFIGITAAVLAGMIPALRAARVPIVEALRQIA